MLRIKDGHRKPFPYQKLSKALGSKMKIRKSNLVVTIMLLIAGGASQADTRIGVGTGYTTGYRQIWGGTIAVPVRLDSYLLIEPFIDYRKRDRDSDEDPSSYNFEKTEGYQAGIGLFALNKMNSEFEIYYGATLGVGVTKSNYESKFTNYIGTDIYEYLNTDKTETKQYHVKPTFGISYFINENFSFSLDTGISYYWGEEESERLGISTGNPVQRSESKADISGTDVLTRFVFRMMF